jgi:MFS family permease
MMLAKARGRLGVTLKSLTRVNPRTIRLLKRLNTLAALGGNGRLARSREVTRLNRAGRTGSVDFDPEWLHVALHQQMQAPDGGWRAWSVVFGYFLVCFSTLGVQWAYSAIYGELLRALDEGPALTALVGSLCMGVMEGFAVLAALTISRFGSQRACQIGGVLAVAGLLLSAACTSVWQLCLTFGIITGLGHSLAFFSPIVLMPRWFNTKLTRAHALGNIGAALTPLVLGPVLPPMVATIGWQQMFLVLAAATALLLGLASALLIEPEESSRFSRIFSTTRRASRRPNSSRDSTGSSGSFTGGSGRFEGSILTPSPTRARIDTRARFARTPRSPQPEADAAEPVGADESGAAEAKLPKALGGVQRSHTEARRSHTEGRRSHTEGRRSPIRRKSSARRAMAELSWGLAPDAHELQRQATCSRSCVRMPSAMPLPTAPNLSTAPSLPASPPSPLPPPPSTSSPPPPPPPPLQPSLPPSPPSPSPTAPSPLERRSSSGLSSLGSGAAASEAFLTLRSVIGIGRIQRLCVVVLLYGMGSWVAVVHLLQLGIERGLALEQAGTLLMFLAAGSAGMRLPLAYAADWFGRQRTWAALLAVHAALDLVCASSFEFASSRPFLSGFAFGVGSLVGAMNSILVSLPSEMNLSPLASRLAVPIICSPLGAGMLVGPWIAGAIRSATSSYNDALLFAFACFVGAFGLYTASLVAECCSCTSEHAADDDASENAADNGAPARARVDSASPVKAWMAASVGEQGSSTTSFAATRTRHRLKPVTV